MRAYEHTCENGVGSYFGDDDLIGNTLCGGFEFDPTDQEYKFMITEMNTFTIRIEEK